MNQNIWELFFVLQGIAEKNGMVSFGKDKENYSVTMPDPQYAYSLDANVENFLRHNQQLRVNDFFFFKKVAD